MLLLNQPKAPLAPQNHQLFNTYTASNSPFLCPLPQICKAGMAAGQGRKIWLTRHGESEYNTVGKVGGGLGWLVSFWSAGGWLGFLETAVFT